MYLAQYVSLVQLLLRHNSILPSTKKPGSCGTHKVLFLLCKIPQKMPVSHNSARWDFQSGLDPVFCLPLYKYIVLKPWLPCRTGIWHLLNYSDLWAWCVLFTRQEQAAAGCTAGWRAAGTALLCFSQLCPWLHELLQKCRIMQVLQR